MDIPENILQTLSDEQKKKFEAARSPEELSALAEECGSELTIDQLEGVSGGITHRGQKIVCPICGEEILMGREEPNEQGVWVIE